MDLASAKTEFLRLIDGVQGADIPEFLQWVSDSFGTEKETMDAEAEAGILAIVDEVRTKLPTTAIATSERLHWPQSRTQPPEASTVHVDGFLYSDDEVDMLVDQGLLSRTYCKSCGSKETAPLNFISHSLSLPQLRFIFQNLLSPEMLRGKRVLDVGSRVGAVVFAGYFYSPGALFCGLELNRELAQLQADMVTKHGLRDRCSILCQDLRQSSEAVTAADVIVLNNVFQYFLPPEEQRQCWLFLKATARSGTTLLTNPGLETQWAELREVGFCLSDWVQPIPTAETAAKFAGADAELAEDLQGISLYQVK